MDIRPVLILVLTLPLGIGAVVIAARAWHGQAQAKKARRGRYSVTSTVHDGNLWFTELGANQ